ncbi:MAG: transcription termination factor NusA [bacterium]|nr:transcription termination factor NusA [bacterium]
MKNEFELAFKEIAELRALRADIVQEALQTALISAYRRDSNASAAQRVDAIVDLATERIRIFVEKEVVEQVEYPNTEVDLEKARYYEPEAQLGDMVMVQVEGSTKRFGRIAAQTAKQVILQKIREAERNSLYDEFVDKEGDIITGQVQSINASMLTLSLGRAEAILPRAQQIPGERHKPHDKIRVYLMEVKRTNRGPQIVVSRAHRNMLRRLLEYEVPEIYNGQVEIKNIAREAGYRSKVAVAALQEGIDPVGACVGMRGIRIQNIVKELHDEKIDVIEWNPNQEIFIAKALSPARVTGVYLDDDPDAGRTAVVIVPDDQLSLAIGREGQNARLAAKLTGWRIDIKSVTEAVQSALDMLRHPMLAEFNTSKADMVTEVRAILDKKNANKTVQPEEYKALGKFADLVERRLLASREEARKARMAEINAVKSTLPQHAFTIPVTSLELPDNMIEALQPLENVGEIMLRFLIDEDRLRRLLGGQSDNALQQLQNALDKIVIPEDDIISMLEEPLAPVVQANAPSEEDGLSAEVFPQTITRDDDRKRRPPVAQPQVIAEPEVDFDIDEEEVELGGKGKKGKKAKEKRRQLVFDEDTGATYARRKRKGNRRTGEWEE